MSAASNRAEYRLALASYIVLYDRHRPDCAGGLLLEMEAAIAAYLVDGGATRGRSR